MFDYDYIICFFVSVSLIILRLEANNTASGLQNTFSH